MTQPALPPDVAAFEMASAGIAAQAIRVVAEMGIADYLSGEATPVEQIAAGVGADLEALYRVMRFLASTGVFRELEDRRFARVSIADIAWRSGFADPSHFARRFRQRYGIAPALYRRTLHA